MTGQRPPGRPLVSAPAGYRVVVGVDGTEAGARALRWAIREAAAHGGAVTAVTVWHEADGLDAGHRLAAAVADEHAHATGPPVEPDLHVPVTPIAVSGDQPAFTSRVLVEQARGADLLVLGSHGYGGLFPAVRGTVADECLRAASCPVVVLPELRPSGATTGRFRRERR
jgi:nucleotide-binding universal stress UspA family protein